MIWLYRYTKFVYNSAMELEELKQAVTQKFGSIKACAEELGVSYNTLQTTLTGKNPMTKALKNHLMLALGAREAVLVYRVDVPTHKVEELTAGRGCVTEADHREALQAIIEHNLQELAKLGAELEWTPEQREALGISTPLPGGGYEVREPFA
ncbi:MAG: hypothetical protein IKZ07_03885 [Akkermansia sp.]|nr:hypothetical protein [Akkermansia sp.]